MSSAYLRCFVVAGCVFFLASLSSGYSRGPCSADEGKQAVNEAATLTDWDSLHESFARYENCDEGPIAAAYSKAESRILVDHWDSLTRVADLTKGNPAFRAFVVKHVDKTLNPTDIKTIQVNAKSRCPAGLADLCDDLKKQTH